MAGGEIEIRAPDAAGFDPLLQALPLFGKGAVPLQTVGDPPQLAPGDGQQLRGRGIAADHDGIPALFQPGDHPGAQSLVHICGAALQVYGLVVALLGCLPFFVPLGGGVKLIEHSQTAVPAQCIEKSHPIGRRHVGQKQDALAVIHRQFPLSLRREQRGLGIVIQLELYHRRFDCVNEKRKLRGIYELTIDS